MVDEVVLEKISLLLNNTADRDAFYAALAKARKEDMNVEFADEVLTRLEEGMKPSAAIFAALKDCAISY
jgi:hypothetical protein